MVSATGLMSGELGETEAPDVTEITAKSAGHFVSHPLFPRDDGQPETRDIRYVSFQRRREGDSPKFAPEEFAADDVVSWAQVYEWWGGGHYKAVGKNKNHSIICFYPPDREWVEMEGESKPLVPVRCATAFRASPQPPAASPVPPVPPVAAAPPASAVAVAPNGVDALVTVVAQLVREVQAGRAAQAAPALAAAPSNDSSVLMAMMAGNATVAAAKAEADGKVAVAQAEAQARAAEANAQAQTRAAEAQTRAAEAQAQAQSRAAEAQLRAAEENMRLIVSLLAPRAEAAPAHVAAPVDSTKMALDLLAAMQGLMKGFQAPAAPATPPPTIEQQIGTYKALRDLGGAAAAPNELQPLVDLLGPVLAAEAAKSSAPRDAPRTPPGPPRPLEYVRDLGMVEVVARERRPLEAPRSNVQSEADVLAAAQRDPEYRARMLRALAEVPEPLTSAGVALVVDAPPAPVHVPAATHVEPVTPSSLEVKRSTSEATRDAPSVAPMIPDLEQPHLPEPPPTPAESPRSEPASSAPVETLAAPSVVAPIAPAPSVVAPIAPAPEPIVLDLLAHQRAEAELVRLKGLGHNARVAVLRKLPGVGPLAEEVARALDAIPGNAMSTMLPHLQASTLSALAGKPNGEEADR